MKKGVILFLSVVIALLLLGCVPTPGVRPPEKVREIVEVEKPTISHIVVPDDSLASIARKYNTTMAAIMAANAITDPKLLRVSQELIIPLWYELDFDVFWWPPTQEDGCFASACYMIIQFEDPWTGVDQVYLHNNYQHSPWGAKEALEDWITDTGWSVVGGDDRDQALGWTLWWIAKQVTEGVGEYPAFVRAGVKDPEDNVVPHAIVMKGFKTDINPYPNSEFTVYSIGLVDPNFGEIWYVPSAFYETYWPDELGTYLSVIEPPQKLEFKIEVAKFPKEVKEIIPLEEALNFAQRAIKEQNLLTKKAFCWHGATTGMPLLVNWLDSPAPWMSYYYLVPFYRKECRVPEAIIMVNGFTGVFLGAGKPGKPIVYLPKRQAIHMAAQSLGIVREKAIEMIEAGLVKAELVYKLHSQMKTPFAPFWKVEIHERTRYVSQEGQVHHQLVMPRRRPPFTEIPEE